MDIERDLAWSWAGIWIGDEIWDGIRGFGHGMGYGYGMDLGYGYGIDLGYGCGTDMVVWILEGLWIQDGIWDGIWIWDGYEIGL